MIDSIESRLVAWLYTEELQQLVRSFNGPTYTGKALAEFLDDLVEFSSVWDFRKGRERTSIDNHPLTAAQIVLVQQAAVSLRLQGYKPPSKSAYNHLLILGGTLLSCFLRTRFAAELLHSGLTVEHVYSLGTRRLPAVSELDALTSNSSIDFSAASDEFEMLRDASERLILEPSFAYFRTSKERVNGSFELTYSIQPSRFHIAILCTEGKDNPNRATTGDTYQHWQDITHPTIETNVLIVTSQIYVPFQEFDAIRLITLTSGASVEVIGMPPPSNVDSTHLLHKPENYLQEIRSGILSAQRLFTALNHKKP